MALATADLKKILVDQKIIKDSDFAQLLLEAQDKKQTLANYLVVRKIIPEDRLAKLVSDFLKVHLIDLTDTKIPQEVLKIIPEPIARRPPGAGCKKKGGGGRL